MAASYEVKVSAFEGPLDLLLQLVESDSLPITEVALAEVTDAYLRRVEQLDVPAEELSHFLVVASRLLLLKSRRLLPRPAPDQADPSTEELTEQLRTYSRFRAAAASLRDLEGRISYTQLVPPAPPAPTEVISLPLAALERALQRSLRRLEGSIPQGPAVPRERLRLRDVVASAERMLRRDGSLTLDQLAGPHADRRHLIVAFLAVLDLLRRGRARVVQQDLFGTVRLLPVEVEG